MQYDNQLNEQFLDHERLFSSPKYKTKKVRKWREIEEIKANQKLTRELHEMNLY